jgi:hypothetical protein
MEYLRAMSALEGLKEQLLREINNLGGRFKAYVGLEYKREMLEDNLAALDRIRKIYGEIKQLSD